MCEDMGGGSSAGRETAYTGLWFDKTVLIYLRLS